MQTNPGKLVRHISEALKEPPSDFVLGRLAEEYAALCQQANQRLEQCQVLLSSKDEFGAWSVASTSPDLFGLLEVLAFPQSDEWRKICVERSLALAPSFDEYGVEQVGKLFGKGLNETHPLYADYRKAVRLRDDDAALAVLNAIVRLNPSDAHAVSEHARLQQKRIRTLLSELEAILPTHDRDKVVSLLEQVEGLNRSTDEESPLLTQAQAIREEVWRDEGRAEARNLVERIRELRRQGQSEASESLYGGIESLGTSYDLGWTTEEKDHLLETKNWLIREKEQRLADQRHQRALHQLETTLLRLESRSVGTKPTVAQLTNDRALLEKAWREVEACGRPVAVALQQRVKRASQLIRSQVDSLQRLRTITISLSATAAAIIIGVGAWFLNERSAVQGLVARLSETRQKGTTTEVQALLDLVAKEPPRRINTSEVATETALAKEFLTIQGNLLSQLQTKLSSTEKIFQKLSAQSSPADIKSGTADIAALDEMLKRMAPNLQAENELKVIGLKKLLNDINHGWVAHQVSAFKELLNQMDKEINKGASALTMNDLVDQSALCRKLYQEISESKTQSEQGGALPREITARLDYAGSSLKVWDEEIDRWHKAKTALREADSEASHKSALSALSGLTLKSDPWVSNAKSVLSVWHLVDIENLLRESFFSEDPQALAFVRSNPPAEPNPPFFPASPPETAIYENMDDMIPESIKEVWRTVVSGGSYGYARIVYTSGKPEEASSPQGAAKKVSWKIQKITPEGVTVETGEGLLNMQRYLVSGSNVMESYSSKEKIFLSQFLGKKNVDGGTGKIEFSPLLVMDELQKEPDLSPLFKAYVEQEMIKIINLRPFHWGLFLYPELKIYAQNLTKTFTTPIQAKEWLYESSQSRRFDELQKYKNFKYPSNSWAQVQSRYKLVSLLGKAEFKYAGKVELDNSFNFFDKSSSHFKIWTLTKDGKLWQGMKGKDFNRAIFQPLAPVFIFRVGSKSEIDLGNTLQKEITLPLKDILPLFRQ